MNRYESLAQVLLDARERDQYIRFIDGENDITEISSRELYERAMQLLGTLQRAGMQRGDELVIFTRSNHDFAVSFWAAVLGAMVPVPVAVGISDEHRLKLFRILGQLHQARLISDSALKTRLQDFAQDQGREDMQTALASALAFDDLGQDAEPGDYQAAGPSDPAFIQYSSGSTGDPKGVCLTHLNICTNIRAVLEWLGWDEQDRSLSWMPLTHDMGLIGYHLTALAAGMNSAIMDTSLFVRRPLLWLQLASELRATQLSSPNFGYKHFLKLFERKGLPDGTDLSSVELIVNGAEPISVPLIEAFLAAMAPFGLKREAMFPVYGLAEATVAVTFGKPGEHYDAIVVDRHKLAIGQRIDRQPVNADDALQLVKCGMPIRDVQMRLVDDAGDIVEDEVVGHIQLHGDSVADSIYGDTAASAALFTDDDWLRTGDCGVVVDGRLVITGRQKDIIIVNGQNYYPHDLEVMLERLPEIDLGKVVVAGAGLDADNDTESLLAFVLHRGDPEALLPLAQNIHECLGEQAGLEVSHVLPIERVPKTTSGKVQRAKLVSAYQAGDYDAAIEAMTPREQDAQVPATSGDALIDQLLAICNQHSGNVRIGADDNLFEVGVSSLTLSEIVLAIDETYPDQLDISDLFDVPTVSEVAAFLSNKGVEP
ncbi:MAG: non-ribosomal peptide synthetase [Pseudomonadota bacterium]